MRPHFWLPEKTSYGERPLCDNCEHYGQKNDNKPNGVCGRSGWICGSWKEAKEQQLRLL